MRDTIKYLLFYIFIILFINLVAYSKSKWDNRIKNKNIFVFACISPIFFVILHSIPCVYE